MYQPYQFQPMTYPMQQQSSFSAMQQAPMIAGRIVKSVDEVLPNEVPMNGSVAVFPTSDMSSIFVKGWNQDGTISTVRFAPVVADDVIEQNDSVTLDDIMDQLTNIQDLLKPKRTASKRTTAKKEDSEDVSD